MAKSHCENIPLKIKQKIGNYAASHGTKAAIGRFSKIYAKFSLKRTTVNAWKEKFRKRICFPWPEKKERPNLVDDEMLPKIRDVILGSRLVETVPSRKMVIAIGTGVIKANEQPVSKEVNGSLELAEGWA